MSRVSVVLALSDTGLRDRVGRALDTVTSVRVVCQTWDLPATYAYVEQHTPDAVVISRTLAAKPEFEVMRALFSIFDVRWLVIEERRTKVRREDTGKSDLFHLASTATAAEIAATLLTITRSRRRTVPPATAINQIASARPECSNAIILIGASTGGIDALLTILRDFPRHCPPTLIVQHTGSGFGQSLADLLNRQCAPDVTRAQDGQRIAAGNVYLAAGCKAHMQLSGPHTRNIRLVTGDTVSGHMPSVDMLFRSAVPIARTCVAVQLTGMGRDGAAGMKALHDAGARTLAQDEATSVIYGMPKAAVELGGVQRSVPLPDIGREVLAMCNTSLANGEM